MANEITFTLESKDADNLWSILSDVKPAQIHPDPGVPYLVHELRMTLKSLQNEPEEEMPFITTSQGVGATPARVAYCKKNDLTLLYFPKAGVEWVFSHHLLVILKLVLKDAVKAQTGESLETLVELFSTIKLTGWFKKNFKKAVSITLDDDCGTDDEIEAEEKAKAEKEKKEKEEKEKPKVKEEPEEKKDEKDAKSEAAD